MHKIMCTQGQSRKLPREIVITDDTDMLPSEPNPCVRYNSTYSTTVQKINRYTCHHSLP